MKNFIIDRWKDSFRESFSQNEKQAKKDGFFPFEVTPEQKEYLEDHIELIDEKCADEDYFGKVPHTIRFEPFWNGMEDVYTCECYFDEE